MLEYLKEEANMTLTENGAATYASTGSECLDLFATVGALRGVSDEEMIRRFIRAYTEDPDTAMKILFFARDIRGGLGERRVFRVILNWLAVNEPASVRKNLEYVAEYGRWDDLLSVMGTECESDMLKIIGDQFRADLEALVKGEAVSLLGKWLPSVNASSPVTRERGRKIAGYLGYSEAEYRKALSALRAGISIIENSLRERDYTFEYAKQPSRAMFKYRKAFVRNDRERYSAFLQAAASGAKTLHADNVAPYELVSPCLADGWYGNAGFVKNISPDEKKILNATWASLPDFGGDENALAVIDTSGSMYFYGDPVPAAVALSLGLYFAEHNTGAFSNCFIQFSASPRLIELKGETFVDRLRYAASFSEVANTDLAAVFDLILRTAVKNRVPQEEFPAKLIIVSDMEFDACVDNSCAVNFENAREKYASAGYALPEIVFWNAASRNRQQPVTLNEQGVALVSGVTPRIFSMVAGELISPYELMMEVLGSERYRNIAA